ncbi:putative deacetylase LmbE-like domain-containing protein [Xylaria cubensis]|nr:putative deacetylase LmbE-like domain-containing protein [Xylaria cubensis]
MGMLLALGFMAVVPPCLYTYVALLMCHRRICLLIAYPDDEAMLFGPTLLALTRPEAGNHVKILCLSTGDAGCLGHIRRKELIRKKKTYMKLGSRQESDIYIMNSADFQDSSASNWDQDKIAALLEIQFTSHQVQSKAHNENVDILITFDKHGVSSHPNQISLHYGATAFICNVLRQETTPVDLYTLSSVSVINVSKRCYFFNRLIGERGLPTTWSAMASAHKSQMA